MSDKPVRIETPAESLAALLALPNMQAQLDARREAAPSSGEARKDERITAMALRAIRATYPETPSWAETENLWATATDNERAYFVQSARIAIALYESATQKGSKT